MTRKFYNTLAIKLTLIIEILLVLGIAATTYINVNREMKNVNEELSVRKNMTTALIQRAFTTLNQKDFADWVENIYALRPGDSEYNLDLVYVSVLHNQEEVIYSSHNPRFAATAADGSALKPKEYYRIKAPNLDHVSVYVTEPGTTRAKYMVSVGYSVAGLNAVTRRSVISAVVISAVLIILGLVISVAISFGWTRPVAKLVGGMSRVQEGDFDFRLPVRRHDEFGKLAFNYNLMADGLKDREFIKTTFKRYVTKQVAEQILENRAEIKLAGEKREVTVLFSDIEGFTELSERVEPTEVVSMLNEYFALMIDIIFQYEGALDKFLGDGIMAYWNAPLDQNHSAVKACIAALEMQTALHDFNRKRVALGKDQLYAGIGINTGEAVAGNIGSEKKMEYTVIGDNVNLAQRIEVKTGRGQTLISESTYEEVEKYVFATPLPPERVKGKSKPVRLYLLHGLNNEARRFVKSERANSLIIEPGKVNGPTQG
jgi:class 3 adenylate cyclase